MCPTVDVFSINVFWQESQSAIQMAEYGLKYIKCLIHNICDIFVLTKDRVIIFQLFQGVSGGLLHLRPASVVTSATSSQT